MRTVTSASDRAQPLARQPDEALAALAQGGSPQAREALGLLLTRHAGPLQRFFLLQLRDAGQAEDLVQEVFLRVIRSQERFDPQRPFRPWLWAIARNLLRSAMRSPRFHTGAEAEALADPQPDPHEQSARSQRADRLRAALAQLPEDQREVIMLKHFQELPCAEVAQALGISEGTVWSRAHRALRRLGEILREDFDPQGGERQ
jgi:RNA polymerase sigma-70 factor (ECF subfamily)